jgi:hypothetical protein
LLACLLALRTSENISSETVRKGGLEKVAR